MSKLPLSLQLAGLFGLGFSSGLPRLLVYSTLSFWLLEIGLSIESVGLFAAVALPYNLKFLWAPILDRVPIPVLTPALGQRRAWILTLQIALIGAIALLAYSVPVWAALAALLVSFFSASQDVVIDAYRVDSLADEDQGVGAAATVYGYRVGMLVAGAGALYLAQGTGSWQLTYLVIAAALAPCVILTALLPRVAHEHQGEGSFQEQLFDAVIGPLKDFVTRPLWVWILAFILFYKLGDALAGTMLNPFLLSLEYSKTQIADVGKVFGLVATLMGVGLGGLLVKRTTPLTALWVGGLLQMSSNAMFVVQAIWGHDVRMLIALIGIENLTGGVGTAAFVAYLSSLCNRSYTATQYALLTALSSLLQTLLSAGAGFVVAGTGWVAYFAFTTFLALPGLALIALLQRQTMTTSPDE